MVAKINCFILLFLPTIVLAQFSVQGNVVDENKQPIFGAAIKLDEQQQATDNEGKFSFEVSKGVHEIEVHFLGYRDTIISFKAPASFITIQLTPDNTMLESVHIHDEASDETNFKKELSADEINEQSGGSFAEKLEQIPGITSINVGVGIGKPVIRGMSFNRVSVLDNGIKQEGQQWGSDHGLEIDAFSVSRVEVINGAQTLLYGSEGMGGIIRILPNPIPQKEGVSGHFNTGLQSNNWAFQNNLQLNFKKNQHFAYAYGSYKRFGDFSVPDNEFEYQTYVLPIANQRLQNTAGKEWSIGGQYQYSGKKMVFRVLGSHFSQNVGFFVGAVGKPQFFDLSDDGNRFNIELPNQKVDHTKVGLTFDIIHDNDSETKIQINGQRNNRSEFSFPHAHGYEVDENDTLALNLLLYTIALDVKHEMHISKRLHLTVGFQNQQQWNTRSGFEYLIPTYFSRSNGIMGHFTYHINENITWDGGIRFDEGQSTTDGYSQSYIFGNTDSIWQRTPAVNRWFWNISGATGFRFNINKKNVIVLNAGTAFRMPNAAELYANGVHHGTFRHEKGNEFLNPEQGLQADLGWQYSSKKFFLSLSPYGYYFFNYIYLQPATTFSILPDAGQIYQYKETEAFLAGAEFEWQWKITPWLHFNNDWSYTYALNLESGYNLPFTPPLQGKAKLQFFKERKSKTLSKWQVSLQQTFDAAQNFTDVNEKQTPAFTLTNLYGSVVFSTKSADFELKAGVRNLFNTSYLKHLSRYRLLNIAEPGRNFNIALKINF